MLGVMFSTTIMLGAVCLVMIYCTNAIVGELKMLSRVIDHIAYILTHKL